MKRAPPEYIFESADFPAEVQRRPLVEQMKWLTETACPGSSFSLVRAPSFFGRLFRAFLGLVDVFLFQTHTKHTLVCYISRHDDANSSLNRNAPEFLFPRGAE